VLPWVSFKAMPTIEITQETFREHVEKDGIVLVDWWAPWCGPCRAFAPIYEQVAQKYPDIVFGKINTEDQPALSSEFGISSIPTLMIFRERVLLFAQPGMLPAHALQELVEKVRALDMEQVRAAIAEHEKKKTPTA
jgi:thioredoxin